MSQPIKVMRIIARLNVGGPAIHVILLSQALRGPDFESLLVAGQVGEEEGDMGYLAEAYQVRPMLIPGLGREISFPGDLLAFLRLLWLMLRERPQVVHTHTAKAGFLGRMAAWVARVPVRVHTFHGHVFYGYFSPRKTAIFLRLERFCARLSSCIITISPSLRDALVEEYRIAPAQKFSVVPLGLDLLPLSKVRTAPKGFGGELVSHFRVVNNIPAKARVIGIVGRLVPIKNHRLFLEAARLLADEVPNLHFVIAGDGESRAEIEAMILDLDLGAQVSLTAWVRDVGALLRELDVLVLTSHNEGTPVSIIEAMAAGVPVVATAVGGVPDLLEGGRFGTLVPPDDPYELASAIDRVLVGQHPDTLLAQQAALANYDISRLAQDLSRLYRDLLEEAGR